MIYEYRCETCGEIQEVDLDIQGLLPRDMPCGMGSCHGRMKRVWSINAVVPDHMKATTDNSINYEKRGTIHKKHFGSA